MGQRWFVCVDVLYCLRFYLRSSISYGNPDEDDGKRPFVLVPYNKRKTPSTAISRLRSGFEEFIVFHTKSRTNMSRVVYVVPGIPSSVGYRRIGVKGTTRPSYTKSGNRDRRILRSSVNSYRYVTVPYHRVRMLGS